MAVVDIFTFNGENAILQLHLGVMDKYVDKFIVVEANKTFTGHDKPMYFFRDERFFKPYLHKMEYYIVTQWDDTDLWEMAVNSPNTQGASHWKREFYIKESIQKALTLYDVKDDDTVIIGDVDEIIDPNVHFESETPIKARLRVYSYFLNNRSSEEFYGSLIGQYKDIKGKCLNHMRSDKSLYSGSKYLGWHFTSMGGLDELKRKLDNSYTNESYYTPIVEAQLSDRYSNNSDFLGRDFTFKTDESDWPQFLKENRSRFSHLCK